MQNVLKQSWKKLQLHQKDSKMRNLSIFVFFILISLLNNISFAVNLIPDIVYEKETQKIIAGDNNAILRFKERDEGNTSFFFDYFANKPSIVHDNNSLDSYSVYSTIEKKQNYFEINCIYIDLKSGSNGVYSKDGRCGLAMKFPNGASLTGMEGDVVANEIIEKNNKINTSYLINGKVKYLPIIIFQNNERYVYKLYKSKDDLLNGRFNIVSCKNNENNCEFYDKNTWVIVKDKISLGIEFKSIDNSNGRAVFKSSIPSDSGKNNSDTPPFEIRVAKAFLLTAEGKKSNSYLLKGDKITLLSIINDNICLIRYINKKNKIIDANVLCQDLDIFK